MIDRSKAALERRLPVGAEPLRGGTDFRVWAPRRQRVEVVLANTSVPLRAETHGYFSVWVEGVRVGDRYRFRLDSDATPYPDPASRYQPEGPHGPSEVVDPATFRWTDTEWSGANLRGQVIYEMHVGTFTREGTWAAAAAELEHLRGICTTIEMMPIAEFAGQFGWGYDGVDLFAPTHLYGTPNDLRAFVDRAHALGFGVILDVVYNHLGPDGNYLTQFSSTYFADRGTDWGAAINYDGEGSDGVRAFFVANAGYWIDEFHFDGLRLDATQNIYDASTPHVLAEIGERVRACARGRSTLVVAENEAQDALLLRPQSEGGYELDAVWNDDFHHSAFVALTGKAEAYYSDHLGSAQELVSAVKRGYLFQGQYYAWQKKRRGTSTRGIAPERFVAFLENHDQVANSGRGARMQSRTQPSKLRAIKALLLLSPGTPMLFQGEEFASSAPFLFFADHRAELAIAVRRGRVEFLMQFPSIALDEIRNGLDDPGDPATFAKCKLDLGERERNPAAVAMHRDLFAVRQSDPTIAAQGRHGMDGAVLGSAAFVLRFFGVREREDRLLVVNLGADLRLFAAPEPLLAPPAGTHWSVRWSSENPRYGGDGMSPPETESGWRIAGNSAVLLAPEAGDS